MKNLTFIFLALLTSGCASGIRPNVAEYPEIQKNMEVLGVDSYGSPAKHWTNYARECASLGARGYYVQRGYGPYASDTVIYYK